MSIGQYDDTYWLVNRWTGQYPILAYTTWRDLNQSQPHISIRGNKNSYYKLEAIGDLEPPPNIVLPPGEREQSFSLRPIYNRGVARNLIWVGINGSRRQNNHIKRFKVDWFWGIYTDIPPVATPLIYKCMMQTLQTNPCRHQYAITSFLGLAQPVQNVRQNPFVSLELSYTADRRSQADVRNLLGRLNDRVSPSVWIVKK